MSSLGNKIIVGNIITFDGVEYLVEDVKFDINGNANITLVIIPKAENIEFSCTIVE